ncbi:MAG: hypothetical protein DRJ01_02820 [Bacteroidetes bacterium]|nr:MAG: hypothetical protein DRJ01_02820 [Bacteroidota bacterium]
MIKNTLIIILFLFSSSAFSQKKCKYEKNEIDALTELRIIRTIPVSICRVNGQPFYFKAQAIGNRKYLKLKYFRYNNFKIKDNSELIFTLPNYKTVTLTPRKIKKDTTKEQESNFMSVSSMIIYRLTDEQYNTLVKYPVTNVKYFIDIGFINKAIKENKQNKIQEILKCVK